MTVRKKVIIMIQKWYMQNNITDKEYRDMSERVYNDRRKQRSNNKQGNSSLRRDYKYNK